jgi:uncharacterized protein YraI
MASFRGRLFGRGDEAPTLYAPTAELNIRSGPGTHHPLIPGSPLPPGTPLELLSRQGSWCLVDVLQTVNGVMDMQGWVHGRFLRRLEER